jgi:radical SAM superfamily enzyme YgiQ (UPF0313 family)
VGVLGKWIIVEILLVNAPVKKKNRHASLAPPLGLLYITSTLRHSGFGAKIVDFNLDGLDMDLVRSVLQQAHPRILGISALTETYPNAVKIARAARELDPRVIVVMGGPHPTLMYGEVLGEPTVDVVVMGEGEATMLELVNHFLRGIGNLAEINGIAYKDGEEIKITGERAFIEDPDVLPYPERRQLPLTRYECPATILSSRGGCPYSCRYCAVNNIWKGKRRYRKAATVVDEMMSMVRDGQSREIVFVDDIFTLNKRYVNELCGEMKRLGEVPFSWRCTTRADLVDEELLSEMRSAGCTGITYGVEAGSQKILEAMDKRLTLEQIQKGFRMALDAGMMATGAFMFPHPQDTEETVREQMRFMKGLTDMGVQVSLSFTTPLPGTYYYEHADELGMEILATGWDEYDMSHILFSTRNLSKEKLLALEDELYRYVGLVRSS